MAPDGVVVTVRLTPKGGRDAIDGIETLADGRAVLKVRVRAAPSEGEANAALCRAPREGARRPTAAASTITAGASVPASSA